MEELSGYEFRASMPALLEGPAAPGEAVFDEGVFVCVGCGLPGNEVSLMPGDEAPACPSCGADAKWVKT